MNTWNATVKYNLIELFRSTNSNSFKALIVLDNIHDFGHDRKSDSSQSDYYTHDMDNYCDPSYYNEKYSCIFNLLLETLNKYTNDAIQVTNLFTPEFFVTGWESKYVDLLLNAGDIIIPVNRKDFWSTVDVLPCFTKDYPIKSVKSITQDFIMSENIRHDYLVTAHFDGCGGTCKGFDQVTDPLGNPPPNFIFSIPTTIGDVIYQYDNDERSLKREFPKEYGKGTVYDDTYNTKRCICNAGEGTTDCVNDGGTHKCFYDRVDKLSNGLYKMDSNVQDTVHSTATNMYKYLDYKHAKDPNWVATYKDIDFFVTLKALGNLAQIVESKIRNCYLFTGDNMQFILGAKMGAMMIATMKKPFLKIYFSKIGAIRYVTYLGLALKKSGVDVEGKSVIEMKDILVYLTKNAGKCIQGALKMLIYFALSFKMYFTAYTTKKKLD